MDSFRGGRGRCVFHGSLLQPFHSFLWTVSQGHGRADRGISHGVRAGPRRLVACAAPPMHQCRRYFCAGVIGSVVGGLFAVGFVAWWFHPNRTRRSTARVSLTIGATCLAFLGLVYLRYVDMPARPAELPPELVETLGANVARAAAFHRYDLGGFIDHEWLWRVDAPPDIVTLVISGLKMHKTDSVPPQLWRMPPYYWPRSMPPGGEAFESSGFSAENRGRDGEHYFLVHDKTQNKAFVWLKSNF
jgi:hypothetical protein